MNTHENKRNPMHTSPVRVAVIGLRGIPATWGGIEHHCEQLYTRLAALGYAITIYGRRGYVPPHITWYHGVRVRRTPTIATKYSDTALYTAGAVLALLADNPDIVHFHAQGPCLFSWVPRLLRPRMKVFFTCHGLDWQRKKWPAWAARLLRIGEWCSVRFPHYRIAVSRHLQQYYHETYHTETHYIPNGISLPGQLSAEQLAPLGLNPKGYLLWVGRIVPEKRLEDVLQAYLRTPRDLVLAIVGESADGKDYMRYLQNLAGGTKQIIFVGYQYGTTLHQLYANALAFVTASELEGLPLTLLEALAHGTVCIASDIPPHREILEPLNGMLFPIGDIAALDQCITTAIQLETNARTQFGQAARSMIERMYSWDTAAAKVDALYRQSLSTGIDTPAQDAVV